MAAERAATDMGSTTCVGWVRNPSCKRSGCRSTCIPVARGTPSGSTAAVSFRSSSTARSISRSKTSLAFGPDAAGIAHSNGPHFDDVDGDGLLDMILHHRVADTGLTTEDFEVCLDGETVDGMFFEGCDDVTPVGR